MYIYPKMLPTPQQCRAIRALLRLDTLTACRLADITPDELAATETDRNGSPRLVSCHGDGQDACRKVTAAYVNLGAMLRYAVDGNSLFLDALLPGRPDGDYVLERFLPTALAVKAALSASGLSDEGVAALRGSRGEKLSPASLSEYANTTQESYRLDPHGFMAGSISELIIFQDVMRSLGIYFIDPDYCGFPGWGLRFKTEMRT